jgi:IclR family pca regulon transcriptional regulator
MLLAHRPIADVKKLLARTRIVRLTRRTIVNQAEIIKAIAAARRDGHALNYEETEDDLIGIAVPVFNRAGLVVAALTASTSAARTDEARVQSEILPRLKTTAGQLTSMLP